MRIQEELVVEGKALAETDAAVFIDSEYRTRVEGYKREMDELREELREALSNDDLELQQELQKARTELEEQISRITRDSENLSAQYANERARNLQNTDPTAAGAQRNPDEGTRRDVEPQRGGRSSNSVGESNHLIRCAKLTFVRFYEPPTRTAPIPG